MKEQGELLRRRNNVPKINQSVNTRESTHTVSDSDTEHVPARDGSIPSWLVVAPSSLPALIRSVGSAGYELPAKKKKGTN